GLEGRRGGEGEEGRKVEGQGHEAQRAGQQGDARRRAREGRELRVSVHRSWARDGRHEGPAEGHVEGSSERSAATQSGCRRLAQSSRTQPRVIPESEWRGDGRVSAEERGPRNRSSRAEI